MNILITGATGGIGYQLTKLFLENNNNVFALGRNISTLEQLHSKYNNNLFIKKIDLVNVNEIDEFFKYIESENLSFDLIINNAGFGELDKYENIPYIKEKMMIDVNIIALTKFSKYFFKKFQYSGQGGIINVSSVAGLQSGGPLMVGYYATKAYVKSLTLGLIAENNNRNINIMLLCPGPTSTHFVGMNVKKRFIDKLVMTEPEFVASQCIKDYLSHKKISKPGFINKVMITLGKFVPMSFEMFLIKKFQENKIKRMNLSN